MRIRAWGILLLIVLGSDCDRHEATTAPTTPPPPPEVEEVFPPARSTGVSLTTPIWVRFAAPLDTTTVTGATAQLRVDTRRVSVKLAWDEQGRRLRIAPLRPLEVRRTHTVDLSPEIAFASGARLGRSYRWQFTTTGVRLPSSPAPEDGTVGETQFVMLSWDSTETAAGTIVYHVYTGTDSAAVGAHLVPKEIVAGRAWLLPGTRWAAGTTTYWCVTALNETTGEQVDGPVWRFETLDASAPVESIELSASDWGHWDNALQNNSCFQPVFSTAAGRYTAGVRWDLRPLQGRKLAGAVIFMTADFDIVRPERTGTSIWAATAPWNACDLGYPGPPYADGDGLLARATFSTPRQARFESDALTAHLEATLRRGGFYGYVPRSQATLDWVARQCRLVVSAYRIPPSDAAGHATSTSSRR